MIHKKENPYFKALLVLCIWVAASLLAGVLLFGCKVTRTKNTDTSESDSTSKTASNTHVDVRTLTEERSTVKTTVEVDTSVIVPEKNIKGVTTDGLFENEDVKINATVDKNGNIDLDTKIKEKTVKVKSKRTTESNSISSKDESVKEDKSLKSEADVSSKTVHVQATKVTNWLSPSWWWLLIPFVGFGIYKAYNYFKK